MSFKSIIRELKEMRDGMGSSRSRAASGRETGASAAAAAAAGVQVQQGKWADLPPELLQDVMERVEAAGPNWPGRRDLAACALVCKSWRGTAKGLVKTPEECGKITFPIALKQPGPRDHPMQCYIRRDRAAGTYRLYLGLTPALHGEDGKLLLEACRMKHATSTDYVISLVSGHFSRASTAYMGRLRSNFLGTKFTIFDSQPPSEGSILLASSSNRRLHSRQVSPRAPAGNYPISTISYELNVMRSRAPRKMLCTLHSIPNSAVQEGGVAPTPTSFAHSLDEQPSTSSFQMPNSDATAQLSSTSLTDAPEPVNTTSGGPLILKNKAPRWHQQLHCWCLNFKGRVTVASVKNFQLVAAVDPDQQQGPLPDQDAVMLQFGKIAKDVFTMDYMYPLSAFQAFAICLSSFDTKPVCE